MPKIPKKKAGAKKGLFSNLWIIALALLLVAGYYFYVQYKSSEVDEEGIVVCNKAGECERSIHIHADIEVTLCSQLYPLPKDTGPLAEVHGHKESNTLHFHERLKVDEQGEILDKTQLSLAKATKTLLGMDLTEKCVGGYCNGDKCPSGRIGKINFMINGKKDPRPDLYNWQDGDKIQLTFE